MVQRRRALRGAGRPRIHIDEGFLSRALDLRGHAGIAEALRCSPRTVRRPAQEAGLSRPGLRVSTPYIAPDGSQRRTWNPRASKPASKHTPISDEDLDRFMFNILQLFLTFGRAMIKGKLESQGIIVSRSRLRLSYLRVHGTPTPFGSVRIGRKKYSVPGVNSLWHHDGQHGLYLPVRCLCAPS